MLLDLWFHHQPAAPAGGSGQAGRKTSPKAIEQRQRAAQIEREDEEILAIVIAAVHAGLIP